MSADSALSARLRTVFYLLIAGTGLVFVVASVLFWHFSRGLPEIIKVDDYRPSVITQVYAKGEATEGAEPVPELIAEYATERRYLVPMEKIPRSVINAFLAAEDDQFFDHPGVNLVSILRAGIANFRAGHTVQGGSTITQQVVKSLLLTSERSYTRKIKEVILAHRLEQNLEKVQILYLYLNEIYLGHGAYGVQSASRTYFQKNVWDITVAEAALLAGLPQAPGKYSPVSNPKKAKERQLYVLRRMVETKAITAEQMAQAASEQVRIYQFQDITPTIAPYYAEHVRRHLAERYGEQALYREGLTALIPTSKRILLSARRSVERGLEAVDQRIGYRGPLSRLKSAAAIEEAIKEKRAQLIDRAIRFSMLLPDGSLDRLEALKSANISNDAQLIQNDEVYEAIVLGVDDAKGFASVAIGSVRGEIPMEKMRWARQARPQERINPLPLPSRPSQVLRKGDVVLVRIEKAPDPVTGAGMVALLTQKPDVQGALLSMEVDTGNVLALEGGYDFTTSEFNRATQAQRQPGSAFKPFIYAAGIERGFTPASIIQDSPIVYEDEESGKWKPSNFEEKFYGDTTFRQALVKSRNVPTIKLVQTLQVNPLIAFAHRLGLNAQFPQDLSIALGSSSVSLLELTSAYTIFPRLGRKVTPIFLTRVTDRDGKVLEENLPKHLPADVKILPAPPEEPIAATPATEEEAKPRVEPPVPLPLPDRMVRIAPHPPAEDPDQVLDPRVAYVMTHLMQDVVESGTGQRAKDLGRTAAGKTGTTNDYIDAWFMGFTANVSTGVWVGYDNLKPMNSGETGARAALPIWLEYMKAATAKLPAADFRVPPGIVFVSMDPLTGKVVSPSAPQAMKEAFIDGSQPSETVNESKPGGRISAPADFFKADL